MSSLQVRPILDAEDVDAIIAIERAISRSAYRSAAFEEDAATALEVGESQDHLVAVLEGRVVGFIVGKVSGLEFGSEERIGWINIVGVDPKVRHKGVGQLLGKALLENFRNKNVTRVRTLVAEDSHELQTFFTALGLTPSPMRVLERRV